MSGYIHKQLKEITKLFCFYDDIYIRRINWKHNIYCINSIYYTINVLTFLYLPVLWARCFIPIIYNLALQIIRICLVDRTHMESLVKLEIWSIQILCYTGERNCYNFFTRCYLKLEYRSQSTDFCHYAYRCKKEIGSGRGLHSVHLQPNSFDHTSGNVYM